MMNKDAMRILEELPRLKDQAEASGTILREELRDWLQKQVEREARDVLREATDVLRAEVAKCDAALQVCNHPGGAHLRTGLLAFRERLEERLRNTEAAIADLPAWFARPQR